MKRHTKASTAGSTQRLAANLGRFLRLPVAVLAAPFFALAFAAAPASAAQTHVFLETFGSAAQPSFGSAYTLAVHQASGDVIVLDAPAATILRFKPNGEPDPFPALGTNVIDGAGPGADQTPENGFTFAEHSDEAQIAVDNSGGETDGNIYVTQKKADGSLHLVDIFASTGQYLGQLTGVGATLFGSESRLAGVAVGPGGNVFVSDFKEGKIYKYTPSANPPLNSDGAIFSTALSDPGPLAAGVGTLYVAARFGPVFKINTSGGIQCKVQAGENTAVAVNPADGHVFVGGNGATKEYDASDCTEASDPTLVSSFAAGIAIAIDQATGKVYLGRGSQFDLYSPLVPLPEATTTPVSAIGETTAILNGTIETFGEEVTECSFEYGLTAAYGSSKPCAESIGEIGTGFAKVHADISGLGAETVYHYRLRVANPNGPADPQGNDLTFQTVSKPQFLGAWSEAVTLHEASLKAQINPQGAATTYRFEWGLTKAPYEHAGAEIAIGSSPTPHTVSLFLQGLASGTTYHYRLVATNHCHPESAPATLCTAEGPDQSFITFSPILAPETNCPNQAFRSGASAFLPDCRAYEMVSPVDKNGGDIVRGELNGTQDPGSYVQVVSEGDKITYTAFFASFAGEPNSFKYNQYLAARHERGESGEGWANEGIHPPVAGHQSGAEVFGYNREFIAFSSDLCSAWLVDSQTPALTPDGQQGYPNLYRRQNCGALAGGLEALTPSSWPLPSGTSELYVDSFSVQGASADSRHVLFSAGAKLNEDAHAGTKAQVYDRFGGENHLVSVLPGGVADPADAQVGTGSGVIGNRHDAVSADGSRVYWSSGSGNETKIYLRQHPEQGIVAGECKKAKACTLPVSADLTTPGKDDALFWAAAADGSKALYSEGNEGNEDLYEFDLQKAEAEEPPRLIAHHVKGVSGASEDLSRIYFVSTEAFTGEEAGEGNSEGGFAVDGEPNLYLEEGGVLSFVATLVAGDVGAIEPGANIAAYNVAGSEGSNRLATRVTPDGAHLTFESRAPLIPSYDNTDSASGKPAVEVYRYEAGGALACISCNPSGGRPDEAGELSLPFEKLDISQPTHVFAAAWIPTWEHPLHASNVLSADGDRLFFNSYDALLTRDTNGAQDVYEWEAPGTGRCDAKDADYFPKNGGCLYLISSGESPSESEFWEASPDGRDVFINTASSLLPQDPGLVDLYDARVEGGFPRPVEKSQCEGEACQSAPPAPNDPTPASSAFRGAGNLKQRKGSKSRCPKGKRKVRQGGKPRCIAPRHKKQGRRANDNRRAPR